MIGTETGVRDSVPHSGMRHLPAPELIGMMHRSLLAEMKELQARGARSGRAAREVLELFAPHVAREEEQLFPVLTAIAAPAASGEPPAAGAVGTIGRFLETGLAQLEADHHKIRRPLAGMRRVAEEDDDLWLYDVATRLAYHIGLEERDYFPAVVMIGARLVGSLEIATIRFDSDVPMPAKA